MILTYKNENGKFKKKRSSGFSSLVLINKGSDKNFLELVGEISFECNNIKCKNREKCADIGFSPEEVSGKCPYLKKLQKVVSSYSNEPVSPILREDINLKKYGLVSTCNMEDSDELLVPIKHDCKHCKKQATCDELKVKNGKTDPACPLNEEVFALSSLGTSGVPVWDNAHRKCCQIVYDNCVTPFTR